MFNSRSMSRKYDRGRGDEASIPTSVKLPICSVSVEGSQKGFREGLGAVWDCEKITVNL